MAKLFQIGDDLSLREEGVWRAPSVHTPEFVLRIRSQNSKLARKVLRSLGVERVQAVMAWARKVEEGTSDAPGQAEAAEVVANAFLADWDGLEDDDGNPIPFSIPRAVEVLSLAQCLSVLTFAMRVSQSTENYSAAVDVWGNLLRSSDTGFDSRTPEKSEPTASEPSSKEETQTQLPA